MKQKTSKQGESKSRNKSLVTSFFEQKFEQIFNQYDLQHIIPKYPFDPSITTPLK